MSIAPADAIAAEPMRLFSTNRAAPPVSFRMALLTGLAPDRGLYVPQTIHPLPKEEMQRLVGQSYADVASVVLGHLLRGDIDPAVQHELCHAAYDFDVPLEPVGEQRYVMRLDQGPTASFKDFAARMMARWMSLLRDPDAGELTILTATSGDTGSAVAHAFHNVAGVRVVVLFPREEVSERQRRQMTTLGDNVHAVAVDGTFDTCQALVKQAFADPALSDLHLTSANSINIGRLLPQAVYYVHAYAQLVETIGAQPLIFAVPSGNFGNMFGAMIAKQLGVPVKRVVAATNANDAAPRFFETSAYAKISPSRNCLSNAMNVGHPSNFARLVALYDGWLDDAGALRVRPDLERLSQDVFAVSIDDDDTLDTLARVYRTRGVLLEPHGAVGWAGLEAYDAAHPEDGDSPRICVETAHPAKFPDSVARATGITPTPPPALAHLDERAESYERIAPDYAVCTHLLRSICA